MSSVKVGCCNLPELGFVTSLEVPVLSDVEVRQLVRQSTSLFEFGVSFGSRGDRVVWFGFYLFQMERLLLKDKMMILVKPHYWITLKFNRKSGYFNGNSRKFSYCSDELFQTFIRSTMKEMKRSCPLVH